MKQTPDESAELKHVFKQWFRVKGYDTPLPPTLEEERKRFPIEWREACEEFERS